MENTYLVGIDVSAKNLRVCLQPPKGRKKALELPNTPSGFRQLIKRLTARSARVALEATGVYYLDLALSLCRTERIEVMVVNPRAAREFANAWIKRSKTDALDAEVLMEFARRMPFQAWVPPADEALELRALARRITGLRKTRNQEKNRLHASQFYHEISDLVCDDISANVAHIDQRIKSLRAQAVEVASRHSRLRQQLIQLTSIKGVAEASAVQILGELSILPKDMTPRQWVAHAGLDPRALESGSSLKASTRVSKMGNRYIREALFMPALTASRHDLHVRAFYEKLIGRGKLPLQAIVAVMRKLLHAIHGMFRSGAPFDGEKFHALGSEKA